MRLAILDHIAAPGGVCGIIRARRRSAPPARIFGLAVGQPTAFIIAKIRAGDRRRDRADIDHLRALRPRARGAGGPDRRAAGELHSIAAELAEFCSLRRQSASFASCSEPFSVSRVVCFPESH